MSMSTSSNVSAPATVMAHAPSPIPSTRAGQLRLACGDNDISGWCRYDSYRVRRCLQHRADRCFKAGDVSERQFGRGGLVTGDDRLHQRDVLADVPRDVGQSVEK